MGDSFSDHFVYLDHRNHRGLWLVEEVLFEEWFVKLEEA